MTEKQYGGATGRSSGKMMKQSLAKAAVKKKKEKTESLGEAEMAENEEIRQQDVLSLKEAGKIAKQASVYAKSIIKKGAKMLDIAEKIESKIESLGGHLAFPVNLSINEIAAHYTPAYNDETTASGLLKVDIGVHVNGFIADTAFSVDLENKEENKKLIEASEASLNRALELIKFGMPIREIGEAIGGVISQKGLSPIRNLTGHEVSRWLLHAGITIPNYDHNNTSPLEEGAYAIEPFATTGQGLVYESKPSGIYIFKERKGVRDKLAREAMDYIEENYKTLPFCSRWLVKKFSAKVLFALASLKQAGAIEEFPQLVEQSKKPVSQAEHTVLVLKNEVEVTTR